jgi:hypothetical protein
MKNKMMLLALGLLALVFAAMPAAASAGTPEVDSKLLNEGKALSFTSSGGTSELKANSEPTVTCTSNHGTGQYTNKTTGTITLTFTGCTSLFGLECHTAGQEKGVITTGTSVFHNVYLTDAKTTPGVLVTQPTSGPYTTFACAGFGATVTVRGNVIGDLSAPKCGATSSTGTLSFTATNAVQTYKSPTATTVNGIYNLTSETGTSGTQVEASETATGEVKYNEAVTVTCV